MDPKTDNNEDDCTAQSAVCQVNTRNITSAAPSEAHNLTTPLIKTVRIVRWFKYGVRQSHAENALWTETDGPEHNNY